MKKRKILYVYSEQPDYVRIQKILLTLSSEYSEVHFVGCLRGSDACREYSAIPNVTYHICPLRIPHGGIKSLLRTFYFTSYVKMVANQVNPDMVIGCNEEGVLPFLVGYIRRPPWVVCELLDSIAIRLTTSSRFVQKVANIVYKHVLNRIDGLLEVSDERLSRHNALPCPATVIYNSPVYSNDLLEVKLPLGDFVFVSGSFLEGISGLETLLDSLQLVRESVFIVAAGRPVGPWVEEVFLKHDQVHYLGRLSPSEALYVASKCLAMFAYYKPINNNYIYAAPNKLFDAMMVGVPILMNSECIASNFSVENGYGLVGAYADSRALSNNIEMTLELKKNGKFNRVSLISLFKKKYDWSIVSQRLITLLNNVSQR